MSNSIYTRVADGADATPAEALDARGNVKDGYRWKYIGFDMAFNDAAPRRLFMTDAALNDAALNDAESTFRASPEGRQAIAYARSCFDAANASLGGREWTAQDEAAAVKRTIASQAATAATVASSQAATRELAEREAGALAAATYLLNNPNR